MRTMQPVADEFLPCHTFALCNLSFVVRKNVIDAAAMDIDLVAEYCRRHRAAFDMPAWTTRAPWRVPFHIAIFFVPRFPKREVADVFLIVFLVLLENRRLQ